MSNFLVLRYLAVVGISKSSNWEKLIRPLFWH
ncbi:hypothetical protein NSE_0011 [Neorickettsia sennetsu str. Miyayama]|uniref:Uncharacterized protein n=1 Tax=Ehrlichia sennetsu (strain ATCC VR-367 / Miyayama) TaxID=222891 RepID=Q2GF42_EHRS3|nr:hypothetical protein NSE_0011 [Neorickettsia sennetsu str. Miyayama]